jgi:Putative restriction endonuclease
MENVDFTTIIAEPTLVETAREATFANAIAVADTDYPVYIPPTEWHLPDISRLITETDEPVDNIFSAKQQRLLIEALSASLDAWNPAGRSVLMDANVGIFTTQDAPPLVPDAFVSVDIDEPKEFDYSVIRAYFVWIFGKVPDVVVEVVSNRKGGEMDSKRQKYARLHIPYYAVFDPFDELHKGELTVYELRRSSYIAVQPNAQGVYWMEEVGLGLRLWNGFYERSEARWLRWCDADGVLIQTGFERSEAFKYELERIEERLSNTEGQLNNTKERLSDTEYQLNLSNVRAATLAEKLRALGIDPDAV